MELRILLVIFGLVVLLSGRRIFWLCVGALGFLAGADFAVATFAGEPTWVVFVVGALVGILGALIAMFAERAAFALVGFYAGGSLGFVVAGLVAAPGTGLPLFAVGAAAGAITAILLTDWAIIVLTSLVGAGTVVSAFNLAPVAGTALTMGLVIVGIAAQSSRRHLFASR